MISNKKFFLDEQTSNSQSQSVPLFTLLNVTHILSFSFDVTGGS